MKPPEATRSSLRTHTVKLFSFRRPVFLVRIATVCLSVEAWNIVRLIAQLLKSYLNVFVKQEETHFLESTLVNTKNKTGNYAIRLTMCSTGRQWWSKPFRAIKIRCFVLLVGYDVSCLFLLHHMIWLYAIESYCHNQGSVILIIH